MPSQLGQSVYLTEAEIFFFNAFFDLATCRYADALPIPWTAVNEYADQYGLADEMRDGLFLCIDAMDREFLALKAEQKRQEERDGK